MPRCPHCSQREVCIRSREAANHSCSSAFRLLWLTAEEYYSRIDFIKPQCRGCWKGKTRLPMSVSLGVVICCVGKDSEGIWMVLIMRNLRKCVCQSCFQLVPVKVQLCAIVTTVSTRSFTRACIYLFGNLLDNRRPVCESCTCSDQSEPCLCQLRGNVILQMV